MPRFNFSTFAPGNQSSAEEKKIHFGYIVDGLDIPRYFKFKLYISKKFQELKEQFEIYQRNCMFNQVKSYSGGKKMPATEMFVALFEGKLST